MYPTGAGSPYPSAAAPTSFPGGGMGRRASSRTLPIIVGVGVAVGVFGGLMIIRGTGSSSADTGSEPPVLEGSSGNAENNDKPNDKPDEPPVLTPPDERPAEGVAKVEGDAASPPVTPPKPEKRTVTLRFEVSPSDADIEVDGKPVKAGALALELAADERKEVEVVVEAEGYEPWTKKVAVSSTGDEQAVSVELKKITRTTPVRRPPRPPREEGGRKRDRDRRPGGIIDL